uniref:Putative tail protein n=1 Tax=viral metagenome TaxID=1070528 RepID=A0A6M3L4F3_9ZZZZ
MTLLNGIVAPSGVMQDMEARIFSSNLDAADGDFSVKFIGGYDPMSTEEEVGAHGVPLNTRNLGTGYRRENEFYDFFYNRMYVLIESNFYYGNEIQAGLVVFPVSYDAEIWNAYLERTVSLNALNWVGGEGISVSGISTPVSFLPLENGLFSFSISEIGPMIISASGTFSFDTEDANILITGSRGLPIVTPPDRAGYSEIRYWSTDILPSQDGTEKRVSRMSEPKRAVEYNYIPQAQEGVELMQNLMLVGSKYTIVQPLWFSKTVLDGDTDGSPTVNCNTSYGEFNTGDYVLLRMSDSYYDVRQIESVVSGVSGSLTFTNSPRAFPAGSAVLPCIQATAERISPSAGAYRKAIKFQVKVKEL